MDISLGKGDPHDMKLCGIKGHLSSMTQLHPIELVRVFLQSDTDLLAGRDLFVHQTAIHRELEMNGGGDLVYDMQLT